MAVLEKSKSSSSSSSSDYSSDDDFIQFDASELRNSNTGNGHINRSNSEHSPGVGEEAQLASDMRTQGGEMAGPNPFSSDFEVGDKGESSGLKQSPTSQVTIRPVVHDPCRIPSSIFERSKSTTPVEWSAASNESLFSINGGNSSFSRDHVFLLERPGELPNFSNSPPAAHPPIPTALEPDEKIPDMGHGHEQPVTAAAANAEAMKDVLRAAADGRVGKEKPLIRDVHHSSSTSRHSDASNQSFAFPILTQGRTTSVKVEPQPQLQAPTQQQLKADDQKDKNENPEPPVDAAQGGWFCCCDCSSCH